MPFSCSVDTVNTAIFFQSHRLPKIHKRCPLTSVSGWLRRYWITRENKLFELMIKSMICEGMFVECTSGWLTGALLLPQFSQIWFWKKQQQKTVMRGNSCSGWSSPCVRLSVVSLKGFLGVFRWGESCWALLICIKNLMQKRRGQLDCLHREALKREVLKLQIVWPNNRCTVGCGSCNI